MVFIGGAVLGDVMKDHSTFWLSRKEWDEMGCDRSIEKLLQEKLSSIQTSSNFVQ